MPTENNLLVTHVHIGELKIGDEKVMLKSILGSCVGVGILWRAKGKVALAHCLLPEGKDPVLPGKYVDQAIDSLLRILGVKPSETFELEAVIAGGANNYENAPAYLKVGEMNAQAALKYLKEKKIRVVFQDLGGRHGRQLVINGQTFEYHVEVLKAP